jgi:hypothetical protein
MEKAVVKDSIALNPYWSWIVSSLNRKAQTPCAHRIAATRTSLVNHFCRQLRSFSWRSRPPLRSIRATGAGVSSAAAAPDSPHGEKFVGMPKFHDPMPYDIDEHTG